MLSSEGRMFPVEMEYAEPPSYNDKRPVWEQAADAFSSYVHGGGEGDVLIFMPGGLKLPRPSKPPPHERGQRFYIVAAARRTAPA